MATNEFGIDPDLFTTGKFSPKQEYIDAARVKALEEGKKYIGDATAFENVAEGEALYMRASDGQVGKASAANGSLENSHVIGLADAATSATGTCKVITTGVKTMPSTIDPGDIYYLSPSTAGAITTTVPSGSGQAIVRVGEGATTSIFSIRVEPPIRID